MRRGGVQPELRGAERPAVMVYVAERTATLLRYTARLCVACREALRPEPLCGCLR